MQWWISSGDLAEILCAGGGFILVYASTHANTEFGAKLHINLVNGCARIERLDFESFNESENLWWAVARYRERYGYYPERILADKIYRNISVNPPNTLR